MRPWVAVALLSASWLWGLSYYHQSPWPRPEALIHALMTLQQRIAEESLVGPNRPRHLRPDQPGEYPVPEYGPHDLVPPKNPQVWHPPVIQRSV